jgi:hypothetical protein
MFSSEFGNLVKKTGCIRILILLGTAEYDREENSEGLVRFTIKCLNLFNINMLLVISNCFTRLSRVS